MQFHQTKQAIIMFNCRFWGTKMVRQRKEISRGSSLDLRVIFTKCDRSKHHWWGQFEISYLFIDFNDAQLILFMLQHLTQYSLNEIKYIKNTFPHYIGFNGGEFPFVGVSSRLQSWCVWRNEVCSCQRCSPAVALQSPQNNCAGSADWNIVSSSTALDWGLKDTVKITLI